jgi:hypothetical protein
MLQTEVLNQNRPCQVREAVTELQDALGPEAEQTIKELIVRYVEPNNPEDIRCDPRRP